METNDVTLKQSSTKIVAEAKYCLLVIKKTGKIIILLKQSLAKGRWEMVYILLKESAAIDWDSFSEGRWSSAFSIYYWRSL